MRLPVFTLLGKVKTGGQGCDFHGSWTEMLCTSSCVFSDAAHPFDQKPPSAAQCQEQQHERPFTQHLHYTCPFAINGWWTLIFGKGSDLKYV